jgi:hypothetical protein
MPATLKILGQVMPAAGVTTTLCGSTFQITISSVVFCNTGGSATTVRLAVSATGADLAKEFIYYDLPIAANDTFIATIGITIGNTNVLRCSSGNGLVAFNAFGVEVS